MDQTKSSSRRTSGIGCQGGEFVGGLQYKYLFQKHNIRLRYMQKKLVLAFITLFAYFRFFGHFPQQISTSAFSQTIFFHKHYLEIVFVFFLYLHNYIRVISISFQHFFFIANFSFSVFQNSKLELFRVECLCLSLSLGQGIPNFHPTKQLLVLCAGYCMQ